jgi:hypothetical protein
MIVVHSGHRLDEPDRPTPRFPREHASAVRERLQVLFQALAPSRLVGAAAAGADLLALEAAAELGIATTVVLPLPREEFRRRSVEDQGAEWVPRFEAALAAADTVLEGDLADRDDWYLVGNDLILDAAAGLSDGEVLVVAVRARGRSATDDLVERAVARGWPVVDLDPSIAADARARLVLDDALPMTPAVIAALIDLDVSWTRGDATSSHAGLEVTDPSLLARVMRRARELAWIDDRRRLG